MKRSRGERKDPTGTAEKKARATQQHLDHLGKLASLANTSLYRDKREITIVLHDSVADSSAWRTPRIYHTQQDPSLINYESTACQ